MRMYMLEHKLCTICIESHNPSLNKNGVENGGEMINCAFLDMIFNLSRKKATHGNCSNKVQLEFVYSVVMICIMAFNSKDV